MKTHAQLERTVAIEDWPFRTDQLWSPVNGEDLVDWALVASSKVAPERVAWVGGRPLRMLFHRTWTNPAPEKLISSFDFVSALREAALFLVAATAE